jgi:two-component sensor histidine kinase
MRSQVKNVALTVPPKREMTIRDVYITDELEKRTPKKADYLKEKLALQELASRMANQPEDILPRFVDLALEITEGSSAGISLYEEEPAPGIFRWHYVRGAFQPLNGATTPRNFSPCGVTLDANGPVLSRHPERVYDWIANANIVVPEVLLVPLYLGGTDPLGTLWIVSDEAGHFDSGHARVLTELAAFAGIALRMVRVEQHLKRALDEQQTLAAEMSHRVKNLFAMAEGIVRMSARDSTSKDDMVRDISGRLSALASAHSLVRRSFGITGIAPAASDFRALVRAILDPYEATNDYSGARLSIEGPLLECGERAMNGMALILHELATNAAKYGALKVENGRIDVKWRLQDGKLILSWVEWDGPPIKAAPASQGFGSTLAHKMVQQFQGSLNHDWQPTGLALTITLPAENLVA